MTPSLGAERWRSRRFLPVDVPMHPTRTRSPSLSRPPRCKSPPALALRRRISELEHVYAPMDVSEVPDRIRMLYASETLSQLAFLRHKLVRERPSDAFLIATLLGLLHGNHSQRGATRGLSISMPNTFAMAPGYVRQYIAMHNLKAQGTKPTRTTLRKDDDLFEFEWHSARSTEAGLSRTSTRISVWSSSGTVAESRSASSSSEADDQHQRLMLRLAIESHFEKELAAPSACTGGVSFRPGSSRSRSSSSSGSPTMRRRARSCGSGSRRSTRLFVQTRSSGRSQMPDVGDVHDGYFAVTNKGVAEGRPRRLQGRRRRVRADHAEQAGAARLRRAASVHLQPLRARRGLGQPERLHDLQPAGRQVDDAEAAAGRSRPAAAGDGERRALPRRRRQRAYRDRTRSRSPRSPRRCRRRSRRRPASSFTGRIIDLRKKTIKLRLKEEVLESSALRGAVGADLAADVVPARVLDRRRRRRMPSSGSTGCRRSSRSSSDSRRTTIEMGADGLVGCRRGQDRGEVVADERAQDP